MSVLSGSLLLAVVCIIYPAVSAVYLPDAWPKGTYALPMADTRCPDSYYSWKTGQMYQDTQDLLPNNKWSKPLNLMGSWSLTYIEQHFCVKTDYETGVNGTDPDWGKGQYCIYKKGALCPDRFTEGWIKWDDQDFLNRNDHKGELPEGVYDHNTKMYFCCREDGDEGTPLVLPVEEPFFLFRKNGNCQSVERMTVLEQWFRWDGEDNLIDLTKYYGGSVPDLDSNGNDHKLIFCYYY